MTTNQINYLKSIRDQEIERARATEAARANAAKEQIDKKFKQADIDVRRASIDQQYDASNKRLAGDVVKAIPGYLRAFKPSLLDIAGGGE